MKKFIFIIGMLIIGLTSNSLMSQTQWNFQDNPLPNGNLLGKIQFVSSTEGWISASDGKLLHTTNGGLTWNIVTPFPNDIVSSITDPAFSMWWVNQTHGWKTNWNGTSLNDANGAVVYKTMDGGNIWTKKELTKPVQTVNYIYADLQGTWQWHELVSANKKSLPSVWLGWGHGLMNVDGSGNRVFSGVVKSDGRPHAGSSGPISISSGGIITEELGSHGFLSADKKTIFLTANDKRGGYVLGVGQKVVSGTTYSPVDFQGNWQMHVLSVGDSLGRYSGWGHATMTGDANGNFSGTWFGPDNSQGTLNLSGSISSEGVITGFGPPNAGNHGFMSADKKSFILTMTGSNGNNDYNLVVFQKQVTGTTYSISDLQGKWQIHALTAATTNNINSEACWMHGSATFDATGAGTVSDFVVNGSSQADLSKSISITADGILSGPFSPDLNGFLNVDKNFGLFTKTDGRGGYRLTVMQKDMSVSGDIGAQVQFVDENVGWASAFNVQTSKGQLFKTTDGGNSWNLISTLPTTDETVIFYFVDGNNGWMTSINDNPPLFQISKTTNGGAGWTAQYTDTTPNGDTLRSSGAMQFIDSNNGWVVGPNGRILKTTNGGATWNLLTNSGIGANANSKCIFFLDASTGWIGTNILSQQGDQLVLLHTSNGGSSWTTEVAPVSYGMNSIFFQNASTGWITGEKCVQNCSGSDSQKVLAGVIGYTVNGGPNGVEESLINKQINIHPNPSNRTLFMDGISKNSKVSVFDIDGKMLINKQIGKSQMDISNLVNGIYIIRIDDNTGIITRKFVKQ